MEREYPHSVVLTRPPAAPTEEDVLRDENMATRLQELVGGREMRLTPGVRIRPVADGMRIQAGENATREIRLPVVVTVAGSSTAEIDRRHRDVFCGLPYEVSHFMWGTYGLEIDRIRVE